MTTEEAKNYCIEVMGMSEGDFTKANQWDVEFDLANEGDWVHEYSTQTWEGPIEGEMKTAIELAKEHKFWSNEKNVDSYIDFMMSN